MNIEREWSKLAFQKFSSILCFEWNLEGFECRVKGCYNHKNIDKLDRSLNLDQPSDAPTPETQKINMQIITTSALYPLRCEKLLESPSSKKQYDDLFERVQLSQ